MALTAEEEAAAKEAKEKEEKASKATDESGGKKPRLSHEQALEALHETRGEAAKNRIEAKKNRDDLVGLKTALAKALGVGGTDEESDVRALTKKVDQLVSKLGVSTRKDAFRVVAKHVGADPDLSWAYLMAEGTLDDPEADVEKALKKALKEKPALKVTQPIGTGDPGAGGTGDKPKSMNAFIRRAAGR